MTGAAGGIGSKTVELLAGYGVHIVVEESNSTVMEMEREGQIAALVESMAEMLLAFKCIVDKRKTGVSMSNQFDTHILHRLMRADVIHLEASLSSGRTIRTPLWAVIEGNDLYVRSGYGQTSRWYQRIRKPPLEQCMLMRFISLFELFQ